MWRRPLLLIVGGPNNRDIMPSLSGLWLECKVTDGAGKESDKASILCVGPPRIFGWPKKGEQYRIYMGWEDEGPVLQGVFSVQKARAYGDPRSAERMSIELKAADFTKKLKASGREHFDEGQNFGDVMKRIAAQADLQAVVDPELAKVKLGYRLRWDQSLIDFAAELGDEVGATVKPAGGKLIAMKRGAGKSAGGKELPPIVIRRRECTDYDIQVEPRPEYGNVAAPYQDEKTGRRKLAKAPTGRDGPYLVLPHPFRSESEARQAAQAKGYELGHNSGEGHFTTWGRPHARAEAPVQAVDFGSPIDGAWKAETIEKVITARAAFTTTINVKAGGDKKEGKSKAKKK